MFKFLNGLRPSKSYDGQTVLDIIPAENTRGNTTNLKLWKSGYRSIILLYNQSKFHNCTKYGGCGGHIHDVSTFTIGNTLTETWRGVRVIRSYSSTDKSNYFCVLTTFFT